MLLAAVLPLSKFTGFPDVSHAGIETTQLRRGAVLMVPALPQNSTGPPGRMAISH
jgi:hypothetical protein